MVQLRAGRSFPTPSVETVRGICGQPAARQVRCCKASETRRPETEEGRPHHHGRGTPQIARDREIRHLGSSLPLWVGHHTKHQPTERRENRSTFGRGRVHPALPDHGGSVPLAEQPHSQEVCTIVFCARYPLSLCFFRLLYSPMLVIMVWQTIPSCTVSDRRG